jgi:hypothetical protein
MDVGFFLFLNVIISVRMLSPLKVRYTAEVQGLYSMFFCSKKPIQALECPWQYVWNNK